jgi:hypothetical protein
VPTPLVTAALGPVTLLAPDDGPRHVVATHGHLWQWVGDGTDLFTLTVAVRPTRLGTPTGARHHLTWELDQLRPGPAGSSGTEAPAEHGDDSGTATETDVLVHVDGAAGSAAADLEGQVHGVDVRHRVVVTTDGEHMHVVRVVVPDTDAGAQVLEQVTSSLHVRPWSMPA